MCMGNQTILRATSTASESITCWFTRRGSGARNWADVVDEFADSLKKHGQALGYPEVEEHRSLGRGARVELRVPAYLRVRLLCEWKGAGAEAFRRGELVFEEDADIAQRVDRFRRQLDRGRGDQ